MFQRILSGMDALTQKRHFYIKQFATCTGSKDFIKVERRELEAFCNVRYVMKLMKTDLPLARGLWCPTSHFSNNL